MPKRLLYPLPFGIISTKQTSEMDSGGDGTQGGNLVAVEPSSIVHGSEQIAKPQFSEAPSSILVIFCIFPFFAGLSSLSHHPLRSNYSSQNKKPNSNSPTTTTTNTNSTTAKSDSSMTKTRLTMEKSNPTMTTEAKSNLTAAERTTRRQQRRQNRSNGFAKTCGERERKRGRSFWANNPTSSPPTPPPPPQLTPNDARSLLSSFTHDQLLSVVQSIALCHPNVFSAFGTSGHLRPDRISSLRNPRPLEAANEMKIDL